MRAAADALLQRVLDQIFNEVVHRDLLPVLRRLEARGEIRGGRFVSGPFGEQYALPEAVDSLRAARRETAARANEAPVTIAAADPLNLAGIVVPGERVPAVPGRELQLLNGAVVEDETSAPAIVAPKRKRSIADMLRAAAARQRTAAQMVAMTLGNRNAPAKRRVATDQNHFARATK